MVEYWNRISYTVQLILACLVFMMPAEKRLHFYLRTGLFSAIFIVGTFLLQYDLWNPGGRNCVFYLLGGVYCRCSAVLLEWIKGSGIGSGLLHDLCCGNAAYSF